MQVAGQSSLASSLLYTGKVVLTMRISIPLSGLHVGEAGEQNALHNLPNN
jgi:hypothetical protein